MSQANTHLIRSASEAFRRRDMPTIAQVLDPEVEFCQSEQVPWGGRYRGHEQVGQFFAKLTQAVDANVDVERLVDASEQVVAVGYARGTARATGKAFAVPVVPVWTVRAGKVTRFEAYIDNPTMLAALVP